MRISRRPCGIRTGVEPYYSKYKVLWIGFLRMSRTVENVTKTGDIVGMTEFLRKNGHGSARYATAGRGRYVQP